MACATAEPTSRTRLFLVDDEPAVLKGLALFLQGHPGWEISGTAESAAIALQRIEQLAPDVAVVDLTLKGEDGLVLIRRLHQERPELMILVFSMHTQLSFVHAAFEAGAHGYVAKDEGTEKVIEAIEALLQGNCYLTPAMVARHPELRSRQAPDLR